jgi:hypothetical protein
MATDPFLISGGGSSDYTSSISDSSNNGSILNELIQQAPAITTAIGGAVSGTPTVVSTGYGGSVGPASVSIAASSSKTTEYVVIGLIAAAAIGMAFFAMRKKR